MEKTYTVYEHVSKDGKRYIGITSQDLRKRWRRGNGYSKNKHFYRAIQKYGWENFEHIILFENVLEEKAKKIEIELIKKYNTTDHRYGYNLTRGGDTRRPCSEEVKEKIRQKNKGRIVSEETRTKISKALKMRPHKGPMTEEQKNKISLSLIGNKYAMGHHNYVSRIAMCDYDDNIIKEYDGAPLAAEELKCNNSGILRACKENSQTNGLENTKYGGIYKGYKWYYVDNEGKIVNNNFGKKTNKRNEKIQQCDLNGNVIKEFEKLKDAAADNGLSKNGLSFALKNKQKTIYKGYLWVRVVNS